MEIRPGNTSPASRHLRDDARLFPHSRLSLLFLSSEVCRTFYFTLLMLTSIPFMSPFNILVRLIALSPNLCAGRPSQIHRLGLGCRCVSGTHHTHCGRDDQVTCYNFKYSARYDTIFVLFCGGDTIV